MIDKVTVTVASTELMQGGTDVVISCDPAAATVWLSNCGPAEVGKGVRLDIFCPKHTFWGYQGTINAIAESGTADLGIHT